MVSLFAALPAVLLIIWVLTGAWSGGEEPKVALALFLAILVSAAGGALGLLALTRAPALAGIGLAVNSAAIVWAVYVLRHIM